MDEYRLLTYEEIGILEDNGCTAEDWTAIQVADDFAPTHIRHVAFYGEVTLGVFEKNVEVSPDFRKHSGIRNATLRNVTVGDNCLIENIGNYINNYHIGEECYLSNVNTIETTDGATFGQGNMISVLNEVGEGNIILFDGLTSQIAALMVKHIGDKDLINAIRVLVKAEICAKVPEQGTIGDNVKIINTGEITNTHISNDCEINGACRLSDCSIKSIPQANVYIGSGVICENSIIFDGSSILNSAKIENCFVGEACQITNGFTAESSVFFANSYMANGEACAAFCGPFTSSHHKSSLLIGGMFSFYNAGSATNFSNHAYKMGPMHYGIMERGSKTASGAYLLMPAHIGTFSVCFGKLMYHPDTRALPFSYLIAYSDTMYLVPGRNLTTVGLYRDIRKWPKRDVRPRCGQKSIVNFDWLSPFSVGEILRGKEILENLRAASGDNVSAYNYHEYVIKTSSLRKGIKYYDIALRIFMGAVLKRHRLEQPQTDCGTGPWTDLSGLLLPLSEEYRLIEDIKNGTLTTIDAVTDRFNRIHENYSEYRWAWAYRMILDYYRLNELTPADVERIRTDYVTARRVWIAEIRKDAEKEFSLGDVDEKVLNSFIKQLDKEVDFENQRLDI
uniref:DUF4954 family protein n=1 Tax=Hoylesella pleuritidis TaxID=407975 RepID=UPI00046857A4|nr:DUF4954 family protein [Hoylesella pleuritidis]